jgi:hypothetical protein
MTLAGEETKPRHHSWQHVVEQLQTKHVDETGADLEEFEIALQRTMRPVNPSNDFRDGLRNNLAVAANRRYSGLEIEARQSYSQGLLVGATLGISAVVVGTLFLLIFRPHRKTAEEK